MKVDIQSGPTRLPPVVNHLTRTEINGKITAVDANQFTIHTGEKEYNLSLNEDMKYRINKKGVISDTQGFHLKKGEKYKVVYSARKVPVVEIITLITN